MNLGSILGLYTIGSPLPTFSCRFNHRRWWSPAEVHVGCPHGLSTWTIQTFEVLSAKRPRQAPHSCPGEPPGPLNDRSDAWRFLWWRIHSLSPFYLSARDRGRESRHTRYSHTTHPHRTSYSHTHSTEKSCTSCVLDLRTRTNAPTAKEGVQ